MRTTLYFAPVVNHMSSILCWYRVCQEILHGWRRVNHQGTEDSEAYGYPGRYTRGASLSANNKEGEYTLDAANVLCLASYRLSA